MDPWLFCQFGSIKGQKCTLGAMMPQWYSPLSGTLEKVLSFKPTGVHVWKPCLPSATKLDSEVPTAGQVRSGAPSLSRMSNCLSTLARDHVILMLISELLGTIIS